MPTNEDFQKMEFDLQEIELRMEFLDATISAITAEAEAMAVKINRLTEILQNEDLH